VLDPFGGSGTTALVADRHKRDATIIELNHKYVDIAETRLGSDAPLFTQIKREVVNES
jgi:DNA modification methylase